MLAWIAVRCLDTSHQRPSAIVAMIFANLIAQSAADIWHIEINLESDRLLGGRLDKTGTYANDGPRGEAVGKPSGAGVYTTQRLTLSKLWEGTRRTCQGLEPDPGNLAVRECVQ